MYPRPGMHFVPSLVRDAFQEPLPEDYQRLLAPRRYLSELDAGVWALLSPAQWRELGDLVVATARRRLTTPDLLRRCVPAPPRGIRLEALGLMNRTYNALQRVGLTADTDQLSRMTLGDLLRIRSFGVKCALDYLASVEAMAALLGSNAAATVDQALPRRAKRLRRRLGPLAAQITDRDLRLGSCVLRLLARPGTLAEALAALVEGKAAPIGALDVLSALEQELDRWAEAALEDELEDLLERVRIGERNRAVIYKVHGLDGGGPRTLQSVGDEFGITRERVRQICVRPAHRLQGRLDYFPSLDRALAVLDTLQAATAGAVTGELVAQGILRGPVAIEGLLEVARWAGRPAEFAVAPFEGVKVVGPPDLGARLSALNSVAKRLVAARGVASIPQVVGALEERGRALPAGLVRQLLPRAAGFEWLDEDGGWFWLADRPRNRLLNTLGKMLAVTPRLRVSDIRGGIARHGRFQGFLPPAGVLLRLCSRLPGIVVEGNAIRARRRSPWGSALSPTEQVFLSILRQHSGVMHRADLERRCLERGMNRATFQAYLGNSPILAKLGGGMYGLRGVPVDPAELQRRRASRRHRRRVVIGWTSPAAGEVTITYRVSDSMVGTGVVPIPAPLNERLAHRRFTARKDAFRGTARSFVITVKPYVAWGFGALLRRLGAAAGDVMAVRFDLASEVVDLTLRRVGEGEVSRWRR